MPEITVSLGFGWVMSHLLHDNRLLAVVLGGVFLIVAAGLTLLVQPSTLIELTTEPETIEANEAINPETQQQTS